MYITQNSGGNSYFTLIKQLKQSETSKFDWTHDDIRLEKILRFLNNMGFIFCSIPGHPTILCLKKEAMGL